MVRLLVVMAIALGVAGAAHAEAPRRRTAVFRIDIDGKVSDVGRDSLLDRLGVSLAEAGFQVFAAEGPVKEMLKARPQLGTCASPGCFQEIATALSADYLVLGRVEIKQRNYEISLELVSGRTGEIISSFKDRCETCGIREAGETMGTVAGNLRAGLSKTEAPAQLVVESKPPGALITLDGKPAGFAPFATEVAVGYREVGASAAGREPQKRVLEIVAGGDATVVFDLAPVPAPRFTRVPWRKLGWAGVGVGLVAIAGGAFALTLSQVECLEVSDAGSGTCNRARTKNPYALPLGATLIGLGGLSLGFGGLAFYAAAVRDSSLANEPANTPAAPGPAASVTGWMLYSRGTF